MPPHKVPEYFTKFAPTSWNVISFLEQELDSRGDSYDHATALSSWVSSLRHFEDDDENQEASSYAKKGLEGYYHARPSDRVVAKNWYSSQKRMKSKKAKTSIAAQPIRTKNVYNGPVNTGPLYHSNLSINQTPSNPQNQSFPLQDVSVEGCPGAVRKSAQVHESNTPVTEPHVDDEVENEAEDEAQDEVEAEDKDETRKLREARRDLCQVHSQTLNKFLFPNGGSLEDSMHEYAMTLDKLDLVHFCIIDSKMLSTLNSGEKQLVLSRVLPLPAFPAELDDCLSRYNDVTTTAECRTIARSSRDDKDIHWIDDVIRHVVELITDSGDILSHDNVNEGVWDCLIYAPFWDRYFADIPGMILQRKEIVLLANQYEPYLYLNYEARYDGVVQSRTSRRERNSRYELCVFETSNRFDGIDSKKWIKDRTKLLAGCRAMLYRLQEMVDCDIEIMTKLQVVGVLQAGCSTQIYIMSCINRNVFYLREGEVRKLPTTLDDLALAYDIVSNAWKIKRIIIDTTVALKKYFKDKESKSGKSRKRPRTDSEFL